MKPINTLFATVLMISSSCLSAQDTGTTQNINATQNTKTDSRELIMFGFKAGVNYSNVYDSRTDDFRADAKFGFAGGAFLNIPINKFIGIQPEALFIQKGFQGDAVFLGSEYSFTRTTNHLDVPFQVSLRPSEFITILAGPQFSYLISHKDEFHSPFLNTTIEEAFNNENLRKYTYALLIGADFNLRHFIVGMRFGWDISRNHGDGSSSTPRYKNTWFMTTIGFSF